jgi:coniferyl-aldehyde dehydrogenase
VTSSSRPAPITDPSEALRRARAASQGQAPPSYEQRLASLEKLEGALLSRKHAAVAAVSADFGNRSRHETLLFDVFVVRRAIDHARANLRDWMEPQERETSALSLPSRSEVLYQPLGVIGIVSPWNYPINLALVPLVAALAAGNRALLKPSELTPRTSELIAEICADAFPSDQVGVVIGGPDVGAAFAALPFDHLVFTGSTRVGKLVMRAASDHLVPVTLELGGKCPAIVGPDFNAKTAASRIMVGKVLNAGQTCIAPDYAIVPESVRETFAEGCRAAVAQMLPTLERNPDYTSIINDAQAARVRALVDDAKAKGARVIELNPAGEALSPESRKLAPTLIVDATPEMQCMQEEIFGPVLPIVATKTVDEAIAYVNARPTPLALYYFGHDPAAIDRVLSRTMSGGVTINEIGGHFMQEDLPFGGVGPSGMGQYHGRDGFVALSKARPVFRQSRLSTRGILAPPYGAIADTVLRFLLGS